MNNKEALIQVSKQCKLADELTCWGIEKCSVSDELDTLRYALNELEKLKKVIEILKKEPIILKIGFNFWKYDEKENLYYYEVEEYDYDNYYWIEVKYTYLKEDFDLLKEVLGRC